MISFWGKNAKYKKVNKYHHSKDDTSAEQAFYLFDLLLLSFNH